MPKAPIVLLAAAISLTPWIGVTAQVTKPRPVSTFDRLPVPKNVTASAMPNGRIQVTWSPVEGAVGYKLMRSMPPEPIRPIVLPDSTATEYSDLDVRPGNTYYYQVSAVNEAGRLGMKASPPPVKALDPAAYRVPDAPTGVRAEQRWGTAVVSWAPTQGAAHYLIQAANSVAGQESSNWFSVVNRATCCSASWPLGSVAVGSRLSFRVIAESATLYRSAPGLSNELVIGPKDSADTTTGEELPSDTTTGTATDTASTARANVLPAAVAPASKVRVGRTVNVAKGSTFSGLQLRKPRWVSLDESKATVDSRGRVQGRAVGSTYIIAIGLTPDGSIASMVQPVDVKR